MGDTGRKTGRLFTAGGGGYQPLGFATRGFQQFGPKGGPVRGILDVAAFGTDPLGLFKSGDDVGKFDRVPIPNAPEYTPSASLGTLEAGQKRLEEQLGGINADPRALNQLRQEALRAPGTESGFARLAKSQQASLAQEGRDRLAQNAASRSATARSQLASQGGLTSGAAERLSGQASPQDLAAQQELARNEANLSGQITLQDEANRIGLLQAQPGQEIAALQPEFEKTRLEQTGISRLAQDQANQAALFNLFKQKDFQTRGQLASSENLARSQIAQGPGAGGGKK